MQQDRYEPWPPELPWTSAKGQQWIRDVLSRTGLLPELRSALEQSAETHHTEIRLAAAAIWVLGCTETPEVTHEDITYAIRRLREISQLSLFSELAPEVESLVDVQIASLEALGRRTR